MTAYTDIPFEYLHDSELELVSLLPLELQELFGHKTPIESRLEGFTKTPTRHNAPLTPPLLMSNFANDAGLEVQPICHGMLHEDSANRPCDIESRTCSPSSICSSEWSRDRAFSAPAEKKKFKKRSRRRIKSEEVAADTKTKTELCRAFEETGECKFGKKCLFAHGSDELRQIQRHKKYKTEICRSFEEEGTCKYGTRCCFIHRNKIEEQSDILSAKLSLLML